MVGTFLRMTEPHHLFTVDQMLAIQELVDQFLDNLGFIEPANISFVAKHRYDWTSDFTIEQLKSIIIQKSPPENVVDKEEVRFYEPLKPENQEQEEE